MYTYRTLPKGGEITSTIDGRISSERHPSHNSAGRVSLKLKSSEMAKQEDSLMEEITDNNMTHDTVQVKIENLQKVSDEYTEMKRQKMDGDESSVYNTVDLYDEHESQVRQEPLFPTIKEKTQEEVVEDPPQITVEDEFIPIGARGKVHWNFAITAASTDAEINAQGPGSLTNAVIQVEKC